MISQSTTKKLAAYIAADTKESDIDNSLCAELINIFSKTEDPYLKTAIKATEFKVPKKAPASLLEEIKFMANAAHVFRGAMVFRALEQSAVTYEMVDGFYEMPFIRFMLNPGGG